MSSNPVKGTPEFAHLRRLIGVWTEIVVPIVTCLSGYDIECA